MQIDRSLSGLLLGAVLAALVTTPASAAPFGPATASIRYSLPPDLSVSSFSGSATFSGAAVISAATGSLQGTGTGILTGQLDFSTTPGVTEPNAISNFLVINDGLGGTFNFNATSVETTSFSNSPGRSTIIGLYVLGSMGDTNLRENPTPTDLLITLTSLFGEPFSAGATLSDPPVPPPVIAGTTVPEPATLALLATGLLGVGLARRKRPQ